MLNSRLFKNMLHPNTSLRKENITACSFKIYELLRMANIVIIPAAKF